MESRFFTYFAMVIELSSSELVSKGETKVSHFSSVLVGMAVTKEVGQVIDEWVSQGKEFTPYQVTQEIRNRVGASVEVVHEDIRRAVHNDMAARIDYESYQKDYGGSRATTYRPIPGVQRIKQNKSTPSLPLKLNGALTVTSAPNGKGGVAKVMTPRSEGRVTVPASALKQIGVQPFDTVWLTKNKNLLTLSKVTGHTKYKADKHGSIRLRDKFVSGSNRYQVKVDTSHAPGVVQLVGE